MLGSFDVVAFVATTHAERAKSFYEQTLGLPLVSESPSPALSMPTGPPSA